MGLFSSKKKIYVSSVVYNLAGDENERPNYLKSLVLGNILTSSDFDISSTIQNGYLRGPGIKLRNFFRWADRNYDYIGMPKGGFVTVGDLDNAVLAANIPHASDESLTISEAVYDVADFFYWADQWMWENHADIHGTEWASDFDDTTGEVVITLADEVTQYRFVPTDFDSTKSYVYVTYSISKEGSAGPIVTGSTIVLGSGDPWPSIVGWTSTGGGSTPHTETLNKTVSSVASFSDGRPNETTGPTTTTSSGSWSETHATWEKDEYQGQDPLVDRLWSITSYMTQDQVSHIEPVTTTATTTETIAGGVTKTTVTTTVQDTIVLDRSYRIDTQDVTVQSFDGPYVFIYEIGSGIPAIDAMISATVPDEQYYPFIPARLDNEFIDEDHYEEAYPIVKKAFKKALGGKYDEFIDKVAENDKLKDIDYTYAVFGVSLNVQERACREYIYRFFSLLMESQSTSGAAYAAWEVANAAYVAAQEAWETWKAAQANSSDPLFGTPEPVVPDYPSLPASEVVVKSSGELDTNFDMRITWQSIEEEFGTGLVDSEHKKGDIWFGPATTRKMFTGPFNSRLIDVDICDLYWQFEDDAWRKLHLIGLVHRNYIYKGKYVEIGLRDAIEDEDESGFIVPLHYNTYKAMPLVKATQMGTACCLAVFNCYVVKKIKWYQRGWFKIFLIVVIIVVSVVFPPFGAAGAGILGSGAAVGAALGFSGLMAVIVGAVANFIAAALLTKLISMGATAIFGAKIGAIIGAIAATVAIAVGGGMMNGQTFSSSIGQLSNITNIINLSNSVAGGIQKYIAASINGIQNKMLGLQEDYDKQTNELSDLYAANIGYGRGFFDATRLTDYGSYSYESSESFLSRTLMTGSDNIELMHSYVTNFASMTLTSSLPS